MRPSARFGSALVIGAALSLGGCGTEVIGGLTLGQLSTGLSLASTLFVGKGTTELAMDVITGRDCRFFEGALRSDRAVCEPYGSLATRDDFRGLMALLDDGSDDTAVAAVDPPTAPDGYGIGGGLQDPDPLLQLAGRPVIADARLEDLSAGTAIEEPTPAALLENARIFGPSVSPAPAGAFPGGYPGGPAMFDTVRSVNPDAGQLQWTLAN